MRWDVIVVGAGAAGLLAATRAAERGRRVLLLEKNRRPGVKILMSGGTRCNLTHNTDARGIVAAYGPPGRFLHSALAALGPADLVALIEAEGVPTKVEATGKVFPVSNRAGDVLDALLRRLERSGATLALAEPLRELSRETDGWRLVTPQRVLFADNLVLTTGGQSYPGSGTTGDGFAFAQQLGHTIILPRPALVPITVAAQWVAELRGVTIPDAAVQVVDPARPGKSSVLGADRGSMLFAHFGLSGPVILNVSRWVSGHAHPGSLQLICDFVPGRSAEQLEAWLRSEASAAGKKLLVTLLAGELPQRLAAALLAQAGIPPERRAAELTRSERSRLVQCLKRLPLAITGTLGFAKAEVTAGGVALDEVDSRNLQSKLVPHLYLAGEILDLDGPIGGYNFQAAFSTGWLAGEKV
jgi:predicted Rossmann fold flavoprotein